MARDQKKAEIEDRTLVFIDEAGFYLLPALVRTWAPKGHPPTLCEVLSRDHLSAISAITPQGKLYLHLHEQAIDGWAVVQFLCHLLRHIPGKLLILWDRAKIHLGQAIKNFLKTDPQQDVWLETFPPYAPELNPDEGVWNYLKNVELKNLCCDNLKQLRQEIQNAAKRMRQKPSVIKACIQHAPLIL